MSKQLRRSGFTIVELLIVIVVIGILAAIVIIAYNGISAKSYDAQLKSDLENAYKQLAVDNINNSAYPTTAAAANGGRGLSKSPNTTFSYSYNPGDNSYCLTGTNNGITYSISQLQNVPGNYVCVSTLAGSAAGTAGYQDGVGTSALLRNPRSIRLGADGQIYFYDGYSCGVAYIRKIDPGSATVSTTYTTNSCSGGWSYSNLVIKSDGTIYALATNYSGYRCVKKIVSGTVSDVTSCSSNTLQAAIGMALASDGNLYVVDNNNQIVDKVNPTSGAISVFAGGNGICDTTNGTGTAARFCDPSDIAVGSDGALYLCDTSNNQIRRITLAGVVTTIAGSGGDGFIDGAAATAQIKYPQSIAVDSTGALFVADYDGHIRQIKSGTVSTLANGQAFGNFLSIAASPTQSGVIYFNSYSQNRIYKVQ
jgi:prepilin-type N-terminal cleavage/methylation domain-containing protein